MSDLDAQIAALKQQIEAKDKEQNQLRLAHATLAPTAGGTGDGATNTPLTSCVLTQQKEEDERSIFVRNVDYSVQDDELASFFMDCGTIEKIKILLDAHTGHPKGNAYICFASKDTAEYALQTKHNTILKGRTIEVLKKRTNVPGMRQQANPAFNGKGVTPGPGLFGIPLPGRGVSVRGGGRGTGTGGPNQLVDPLTYMVYWMSAMAGGNGTPVNTAGGANGFGGSQTTFRGRGRGRGGSRGVGGSSYHQASTTNQNHNINANINNNEHNNNVDF